MHDEVSDYSAAEDRLNLQKRIRQLEQELKEHEEAFADQNRALSNSLLQREVLEQENAALKKENAAVRYVARRYEETEGWAGHDYMDRIAELEDKFSAIAQENAAFQKRFEVVSETSAERGCENSALKEENVALRGELTVRTGWQRCRTHGQMKADLSWGCPDCVSEQRREITTLKAKLERAEGVLKEIASKPCSSGPPGNTNCRLGLDDPEEWCLVCIARRYFEDSKTQS